MLVCMSDTRLLLSTQAPDVVLNIVDCCFHVRDQLADRDTVNAVCMDDVRKHGLFSVCKERVEIARKQPHFGEGMQTVSKAMQHCWSTREMMSTTPW